MAIKLFTSESVTEGHPDKVCDKISDSILDAILFQDSQAHVAVETLAAKGFIQVAGEVTTTAYVEIPDIVRKVLLEIGYNSSAVGFDGNTCGVNISIGAQSPDIAQGVHVSQEKREEDAVDLLDQQGAGDQGIMFGYACDETSTLMPLPIHLAHRLSEKLAEVRKTEAIPGLGPDGKTQVTIAYDGAIPTKVDTVVLSTQHNASWEIPELAKEIKNQVIDPVIALHGSHLDISKTRILVNPTGKFVLGGPGADTGITGRKIIVDTYGGMARHGGGAFSGKDPSKVDRSAAYAIRWVAKNLVAAKLAKRCEVQVAYAIGRAHPVGLYVDTFGTGSISDDAIAKIVSKVFDLRPAAMIEELDLRRPIFSKSTNYGHFGRESPDFIWEKTNRVDDLHNILHTVA